MTSHPRATNAARPAPHLARLFLRWSFVRGFCARGWWLVTSVYLVVVADLPPSQLVLLGTGQGIAVVLAEVPAGVLADTTSRKLSLVLAHLVSGVGMVLTGLVTGFAALAVAQALWGLGWAFASGADVAWITDELDRPDRIDRVVAARARWELTGAAAGLVGFGLLGGSAGLRTGVVVGGLGMLGLGLVVATRFPEQRFVPAPAGGRWREAAAVLGRGVRLARRDAEILVVLAAWLLVNGGGEGYGRLVENRLVGLGFGASGVDGIDGVDGHVTQPVVWFAALGLVTLALGAVVLRVVESRIGPGDVARRSYAGCCAVGVAGLVVFAGAPDARWAIAGTLLVSGVAHPGAVLRAVGEIWVNRRTTSDVRATVHSLLSQAEHAGEIVFGLLLAALAGTAGPRGSLMGAAALVAVAAGLVHRAGAARAVTDRPR